MAITKIVRQGIADDAIDGTKLADDAINSEHITDGGIDDVHIGDVAATKLTGTIASGRLSASNMGSGTIPDARFPSALPAIDGSALTGITTDTTTIEDNIALLGFYRATDHSLSKYNLVDQVIDDYADSSGIDTGTSTNEILTSGYYTGESGDSQSISATGGIRAITGSAGAGGTGSGTSTGTGGGGSNGDTGASSTAGNGANGAAGGGGGGSGANRGGNGGTGSGTYGGGGGGGGSDWDNQSGGSFPASAGGTGSTYGGAGGAGGQSQDSDATDGVDAGGLSDSGGTKGITGGARNNNGGGGGGFGGGGGGGADYANSGGSGDPYAGGGNGGSGGVIIVYTNSGTQRIYRNSGTSYSVPAGSTNLTVHVVGGGGGGCNNPDIGNHGGGGGGGGGYACTAQFTDAVRTVTYSAGASGVGGATTATNGGTTTATVNAITNDIVLQSVATTAESAPTTGDIVMLIEDATGTATINTDVKAYISRDGSAFTSQVTLTDEGNWGTNKRILAAHDVDISGITSGTAMKYKITTHNQSPSKVTRIHATSLAWA